jgi:hypothetical protein
MFGSLGKWILSQGSSSQVSGVHVVKSFMSRTPRAAAAAAEGSAAGAAAVGEVAPPPLSGLAVAAPPPARVCGLVGDATLPLEPFSSADSSASA